MKVKTKLIASIMSICLVCAVFAIGVFALKTANLKIGGDVSFSATGVEADIKNVTLTGATNNDQVLATGSINTSMTQADIDTKFQNWQSLKLFFDENATDIELKFDIANTSTNADNYIEIDYSYSFSNANPNVGISPGDENAEGTWENNEYILAPKGTAATATYETFTLKFKVLDKEINVPQDTKVSVNIQLKHITPVNATGVWNFVANSPNVGEATLQRLTDSVAYTVPQNWNGVLEIPAVITDGVNNYIVTKIYSDGGVMYPPELLCYVPLNTTQVFFPNSIKEMAGVFANEQATILTSVDLSISLQIIGTRAFYGAKLTSLFLPSSVRKVGSDISNYCANLASIEVESGNLIYDSRNNCNAIIETETNTLVQGCKATVIPNSVTSIGNYAFEGCTSLTSITIPSSVTKIGLDAFKNTPWYNNQPDGLIYINNILYEYKGTMPAGTSIEVKEGTVSISGYAFEHCTGLTTITIPSSVTSIGSYALYYCSRLTSITIPSSVTSIGSYAFSNCSSLTSITIPSSVKSIGDDAFSNCSGLTSITIQNGVTCIGDGAFSWCSRLTSITIPSSVTSIGSSAFNGCSKLTSAKFEETTGWFKAASADATEGENVTVTSDFTEENANVLKGVEYGKYLLRKDA